MGVLYYRRDWLAEAGHEPPRTFSQLERTALASAPIVPVSSRTGEGVPDVLAALRAMQRDARRTEPERGFRLSIDRSFALAGVGTVVTGTAVAGQVQVDDRLMISPSGQAVRVRGIHAHNRRADQGHAGQRLALSLAGVDKDDVRRGDWVLAPALHAPTQRLDVHLRVLASEPRPLAHWTPVHVHIGACDIGARIVPLEGTEVAPGAQGLVQLELERPIGALWGDRLVIRDQSATRTIGGGHVVNAVAAASRRHKARHAAWVRALDHEDPAAALAAALALERPQGLDLAGFARQRNLAPTAHAAMLEHTPHRVLMHDGLTLAFAPGQLERYSDRVLDHLTRHHQKNPDSPGQTLDGLVRALRERPSTAVFPTLLDALIKDGRLRRTGPHLSLASHTVSLQGLEKAIWERIKPMLDEGGIHPPKLDDILMRDRSLRRDQVLRTLQRLERMGKLRAVGNDYFIQLPHLLRLAQAAEALAKTDANRRLNVKELREQTGISRHLSLPLVEFFDRIGLTERDAVGRHFKRDPRRLFDG